MPFEIKWEESGALVRFSGVLDVATAFSERNALSAALDHIQAEALWGLREELLLLRL